jgi:hypothetical protein
MNAYKGLALVVIFLGINSSAQQQRLVPLDTLKKFVNAKKPCVLSLAKEVQKGFVMDPFICVSDGVVAPGTIYEAKGCVVVQYSSATGRIFPFLGASAILMPKKNVGKKCDKAGITEVLGYAVDHYFNPFPESIKENPSRAVRKELEARKLIVISDKLGVWTK